MAVEKLAVSVVEAAKLISVSKSTAYALIEQGRLPAIRVGEKRIIVPVKSLEHWLEQGITGVDNGHGH